MNKNQLVIVSFFGLIVCTILLWAKGNLTQNLAFAQTFKTQDKRSIKGILAKSDNIDSVRYEVVQTLTSPTDSSGQEDLVIPIRVWEKPPYAREESTMFEEPILMEIRHPDAVYRYDMLRDVYIRESISDIPQDDLLTEILKQIKESTELKVIGTEIIDGEETTIIEYSYEKEIVSYTAKAWIWNKKGIPLKIEKSSRTGKLFGMQITEIKNLVFENIPDSMFEIPQNKIQKLEVEKVEDLIESAKLDINSTILTALKMYELDNDTYPTTKQGIPALVSKPTIVPIPQNWKSPYLTRIPKDPWGNDYVYYNPSKIYEFDLYSLGPDGIENTKDDIKHQEPKRHKKDVTLDSQGLVEILKGIESIIRDDSFISTNIKSISKGEIVLSSITPSPANVFKFIDILEKCPLFKDVESKYLNKTNRGVEFKITFYLAEKVKDKEFRSEQLSIFKNKFSKIEFNKFKEIPKVQKDLELESINKIDDFELIGIIGNQAMIKILGEQKTYFVNEGDLIGTFKVIEIEKSSVTLSKGHKQYIIKLE